MSTFRSIKVSLYENQIPPFAETEMERLYGSLYSSLAYFRIYGGAENVSTYVTCHGSDVTEIFLFRFEGNKIRVINEGIRPSQDDLERFADYMFAKFPSSNVIIFHALGTEVHSLGWPYQCAVCTDNIAVTLDPTVQHYLARLGSATRKNIKRHKSKLERMHPTFRFHVQTGKEVDEQDIRDIIAFNRERMTVKGKESSLDEEETQRIIRLVRERGLVMQAKIDGKIAGGAIVLRLGDSFCSLVNAHDTQYDSHRLGTLCCFLTICECIERGGKRFDLMSGHYEYKTSLLGEHRYLYRFVAYRSRVRQMLNYHLVVHTVLSGWLVFLRMRMLELAHGEGKADAPLLVKMLNLMRGIKGMLTLRKPKHSHVEQPSTSTSGTMPNEEQLPL